MKKHFISHHKTVRFKRRNAPFHPVNQTDMSHSRFRYIGKGFCFTRKRIRFLQHNDHRQVPHNHIQQRPSSPAPAFPA